MAVDMEFEAKLVDRAVIANKQAPLHRYEIRISIGANTAEYAVRSVQEILQSFEAGNISNSCSGGWGGSHSVTTVYRDISPDDYRAELERWRKEQP